MQLGTGVLTKRENLATSRGIQLQHGAPLTFHVGTNKVLNLQNNSNKYIKILCMLLLLLKPLLHNRVS